MAFVRPSVCLLKLLEKKFLEFKNFAYLVVSARPILPPPPHPSLETAQIHQPECEASDAEWRSNNPEDPLVEIHVPDIVRVHAEDGCEQRERQEEHSHRGKGQRCLFLSVFIGFNHAEVLEKRVSQALNRVWYEGDERTHDSKSAILLDISTKFCSVSSALWRQNSITLSSRPLVLVRLSTMTDLLSPSLILSSSATRTRCWSSRMPTMVSSSCLRDTNFSWYFRLRGLLWTSAA